MIIPLKMLPMQEAIPLVFGVAVILLIVFIAKPFLESLDQYLQNRKHK